ncbi:MAG TPA: response regulator [Polyangiaceae bacterium]|nr:response regulator [Polyangiaceae bacterium]
MARTSSRSTNSPNTILVADDDEDMLALVSSFLRTDGYRVMEARDGQDLLDQLQRTIDNPAIRPDVVVADIMMPRLTGIGVLDALRRAQVHVPVVLMTVLADPSINLVARRLGAVGVLRKPFDASDLRAAVVGACLAYSSTSRRA